jgi:cell wall assembly regulator SMI1
MSGFEENAIRTWSEVESRIGKAEPQLLSLLPPGATEANINALESHVGAPLPPLVRALYRVHDGIGMPATVREGEYLYVSASTLLTLADAVDAWQSLHDLSTRGVFDDARVVVEGPVRQAWWHPAWLPVTSSSGGDCYCIDLDPPKGGTVGQVVNFWHDSPERSVQSPDLATFLLDHLDEYEWAAVWRERLKVN